MADERLNLEEVHRGGGYGSEFDDTESKRGTTWRDDELSGIKRKSNSTDGLPSKKLVVSEYSREEGRNQRFHLLSMNAYSRHKKMINDYVLYYGSGIESYKRDSSRDKSDFDVLREEHRFVWNEEDNPDSTWEKRLAKKYYDKLFKEYCISDLSRYKENKVAFRWRTDKEVVDGKGQFVCGDRKCPEKEGLRSWEVNFAYLEQGEKKNTLVKLRLCPDCSYKLNYHHKKKVAKQKKKESRKEARRAKNEKRKKRDHREKRDKNVDEEDSSDSENSDREKSPEALPGTSGGNSTEYKTTSVSVGQEGIWKGPAKIVPDKTKEEEFDEYFEGMFL